MSATVNNALPAATNLFFGTATASGTLNLNNNNQSLNSLQGGNSIAAGGAGNYGVINTGSGVVGGVVTINNTTAPTTFSGVISGTGGLILSTANTQTLTLSGQNSYGGPTIINNGTLRGGISGSINATFAMPDSPSGALSNGASGSLAANTLTGSFTNVTLANTPTAILNVGTSTGNLNGNVLWIGNLQGGPSSGGVQTGPGDGVDIGSGGWLMIYLTATTVYSGDFLGFGNVYVITNGNSWITTATSFSGAISITVDPSVTNATSATSGQANIPVGSATQASGIDLGIRVSSVQYASIKALGSFSGAPYSGFFDAYSLSGNPGANHLHVTLAATSSGTPMTFGAGFFNDVGLIFDSSLNGNNISATLILSGLSPTNGAWIVGNSQTPSNSGSSATLIVTGTVGDNATGLGISPSSLTYSYGTPAVVSTITAATSGGGTLSLIQGGTLSGTGTVNLQTTVNGGTIRGGIANGTTVGATNYGTLTFGTNGISNGGNQTILGGSTIFTEVNRTNSPLTSNTFTITGGAVAGDASRINVSSGVLMLGTSGSPLSSVNRVNIAISDTTGTSLVSTENYTFTLATTSGGINLNGTLLSTSTTTTIDSGTGVGAGTMGIASVSFPNSPSYASAITAWSLINNSGTLQLTVSTGPSVPEPGHVMLICAVFLGLGFVVRRRRWMARAAAG